MSPFPADPLDVELIVRAQGLAWQVTHRLPQLWRASADVVGSCDEAVRHVGDVVMWLVPHDRREPMHPDLEPGPGSDAERLIAAVHAPSGREIDRELDELITHGPHHVLVVESWRWAAPWRELGGPLLAATIGRFQGQVRLAVCQAPAVDDHSTSLDDVHAAATMLEKNGWRPWRDLHVADPRAPELLDSSLEILEAWIPAPIPD